MHDNRHYWTPPDGLADDVKVFLVRAPIAFGHSQVIVSGHDLEPERFLAAARATASVIAAFRRTLTSAALNQFEPLARYTFTSGAYVKTLVLRASANEPASEYKVHLVPYFESHQQLCRLNYYDQHRKHTDGGLLSWLGKREADVDRWENGDLSTFVREGNFTHIDDVARDLFRLQKLSEWLMQVAPQ